MSLETQFVKYMHYTISNIDGAMNRGHKQTDSVKWISEGLC